VSFPTLRSRLQGFSILVFGEVLWVGGADGRGRGMELGGGGFGE